MNNLPKKALSVRQPWAWAIIHGGKDVENRSAFAITKGDIEPMPICVHASKGMTRLEYEYARDFMERLGVECPMPADLPRGAVIGTVTVTRVVKTLQSRWFFGPRGLVLQDPAAIDAVPASGALGYFDWQPGGDIAPTLPWMEKWPNGPSHRNHPAPAPLFAQSTLPGQGKS